MIVNVLIVVLLIAWPLLWICAFVADRRDVVKASWRDFERKMDEAKRRLAAEERRAKRRLID